jgi:JAB1/Mov34/MPN/PAD-1 ubiquitin protease
MEVMGLMLGDFVDEYTVKVVDVFAMPQSGTGVSVEAVDPVFQMKMLEMLKQVRLLLCPACCGARPSAIHIAVQPLRRLCKLLIGARLTRESVHTFAVHPSITGGMTPCCAGG